MKIEILGCSGSVMRGYNTTSILVNGDVLVDAGSAASVLTEQGLGDIRHILITHPHIDHIKELPFILEAVHSLKGKGVTIWGSRSTLEALGGNIFNGIIWPRITELNNTKDFVAFCEVPEGRFTVGDLTVEAFRAEHIPGSLSYLLEDAKGKVLFSGDTGPDDSLFDLAGSLRTTLKAVFVEVSFPDRMEEFARLTRHLTPSLLLKGLEGRVQPPVRVFAYHIKPKFIDEVVAQLPPNVAYITGGEVFEF